MSIRDIRLGAISTANYCAIAGFIALFTVLHLGPTRDDKSPMPADEVTFSQSSENIECYDFVEVTIQVVKPAVRNLFADVTASGRFRNMDQGNGVIVDGFCDDPNGKIFRIRFMPAKPGGSTYSVAYRHASVERVYNGVFTAVEGKRRGMLRVDPDYAWHFIWDGSRDHYFLNGTTAFLLMGWDNEQVIRASIDRLHSLEVNRIRVLLDGRTDHFWSEPMLYRLDPYHHLATSHPIQNEHQDRTSQWFAMTSFQRWQRPLHGWMLLQRKQQSLTGRIIPQVNEEYGYEDHYPPWAPYAPPAASADANRRAAWEVSMAACYQTSGETAKRGTGVPPDTGGGWVNGRGDGTMVMLKGYTHIVHSFTSFEWWKAEPHDELVNNGAYCLAEKGRVYLIYLPSGGDVSVKLEPGRYQAKWFNPRSGEYSIALAAEGPAWTSSVGADRKDWVLLLTRIQPDQ